MKACIKLYSVAFKHHPKSSNQLSGLKQFMSIEIIHQNSALSFTMSVSFQKKFHNTSCTYNRHEHVLYEMMFNYDYLFLHLSPSLLFIEHSNQINKQTNKKWTSQPNPLFASSQWAVETQQKVFFYQLFSQKKRNEQFYTKYFIK